MIFPKHCGLSTSFSCRKKNLVYLLLLLDLLLCTKVTFLYFRSKMWRLVKRLYARTTMATQPLLHQSLRILIPFFLYKCEYATVVLTAQKRWICWKRYSQLLSGCLDEALQSVVEVQRYLLVVKCTSVWCGWFALAEYRLLSDSGRRCAVQTGYVVVDAWMKHCSATCVPMRHDRSMPLSTICETLRMRCQSFISGFYLVSQSIEAFRTGE